MKIWAISEAYRRLRLKLARCGVCGALAVAGLAFAPDSQAVTVLFSPASFFGDQSSGPFVATATLPGTASDEYSLSATILANLRLGAPLVPANSTSNATSYLDLYVNGVQATTQPTGGGSVTFNDSGNVSSLWASGEQQFTLDFFAPNIFSGGSSLRIEMTLIGPGADWLFGLSNPGHADLSVQADLVVPEPSTVILLCLGVCGLLPGFRLCRRQPHSCRPAGTV